MRVNAFFISRKAWFKVGTKQKQWQHGKHVRLLFPFWFAGAKVGPWVTDCAFEWKGFVFVSGFTSLLPTPGFCVAEVTWVSRFSHGSGAAAPRPSQVKGLGCSKTVQVCHKVCLKGCKQMRLEQLETWTQVHQHKWSKVTTPGCHPARGHLVRQSEAKAQVCKV